ncbi:MAG: DASS family sodium-coupled anion symporter [Rectinema sp.]
MKKMNKASETRRFIGIGVAIVLFSIIAFVPLSETFRHAGDAFLDPRGQRALAVLIAALVMWIMETLPFHITGLLAMLMLTFVGAGDFQTIVKNGFGDDVVLFFIGVLALAAAIVRSGLGKRVSLLVLSITGNSSRRIIFGFLAAGAFLSMWVTAMASSAIIMPLALAILTEEGAKPGESRFGRALMLAVAWGALIGAVGTPAGSGSNPIVVKFMGSLAHIDISFTRWMQFGLPILILLLPAAWAVLILLWPPEMTHLRKSRDDIKREFASQAPMSRDEIATLIVFAITVAIWILSPILQNILHIKLPISMGAILAVVLLFFPGMTSFKWKDLEKEIDWSGIILIAAGISLGMTLYQTGAAAWLSAVLLGGIGSFPLFMRIILIVLAVLAIKIVFSSNTLTGTIIVPLVLALGPRLGTGAAGLALAAGFTANLAIILVTSSPVNIIPYTTGYFSIRDMAIAGLILMPVVAIVIALVFSILGPITGIM